MCGIIASLIQNGQVFDILLDGLRQLENRGYDSAGIASIDENHNIVTTKFASSNNTNAINMLEANKGVHANHNIGIAHTRWATHGPKTTYNSHPHGDTYDAFALVHNGIIENYATLRDKLMKHGYTFKSQTDSEVAVNLISYHYHNDNRDNCDNKIEAAIRNALLEIEGTYAFCIITKYAPNTIYAVRHGSPLLVSIQDDVCIVASESAGFNGRTNQYICLDNNDLCIITYTTKLEVHTAGVYTYRQVEQSMCATTPSPFEHWTLKEIYEQPEAIMRALGNGGRILDDERVKLGGLDKCSKDLADIDHIIILGCGTSYNAGMVGVHYFRELCKFTTVQIFDGGEFTRCDIPKSGKVGYIFMSQSGETKDLHRCIELLRDIDNKVMIGVVNVVDSLIAREVDCGVYLNAGREVGVASTKSFMNQVVILSLMAIWFAQNQGINHNKRRRMIQSLRNLSNDVYTLINSNHDVYKQIAEYMKTQNSLFILGKYTCEAIAHEGALKIKEIGYIHAEGYSSSALKHGPYSLLDNGTPVIIITPNDDNFMRNQGIVEEVCSRNAYVIGISDNILDKHKYNNIIKIPNNDNYRALLSVVPMQLIAYYLALCKGYNIDRPRNLAKVVTTD